MMRAMDPAPATPPRRSFTDSLATVVASGLGLGYSPLAPGTFGAALGVVLFWLARGWPLWAHVVGTLALFFAGVAASQRLATLMGKKDPGRAVVDEVAGMWVSLLALPFTPRTALLAFIAFRITDTLKPWPARQMEDLPGGWGIMADDMMAGVYANLLVRIALLVWPLS
jgi:phosphatidylglycerophosphatase A